MGPRSRRATELRRLAAMGIKFIGEENINPLSRRRPRNSKTFEPQRRRKQEGQRAGHGPRGQRAGDARGGESRRAEARAHAAFRLDDQRGCESREGCRRAGSCPRSGSACRCSTCSITTTCRRSATARNGPTTSSMAKAEDSEAGYKAVNARTLWDNGVVYGYAHRYELSAVKGLSQELQARSI